MSILDFVPEGFITTDGDARYEEQKSILLQVEKNYERFDVLVIPSDVGTGKSLLGQVISRWRESKKESTATIVHRVSLQNQYQDTFAGLDVLKGRQRYKCIDGFKHCEEHYDLFEEYCTTCPYAAAKAKCISSANAVFNFQSYLLNKAYKDNLIVDEAHNILSIMGDFFSLVLWRHIHDYPDGIDTHGDVAIWLEAQLKTVGQELAQGREELRIAKDGSGGSHILPRKYQKISRKVKELSRLSKKYEQVLAGLQRAPMNYFIEHSKEEYRGELLDCLKIRPTTLRDMPEILWPQSHTKKIILMSGTIAPRDIAEMGLHGRKVKFLDTNNPIEPDRRQIIIRNPLNMSYKYQDKNIKPLALQIKGILEDHPDVKGMVHMTYGMAAKMKKLLKGDRFMWHTKENKEDVLKEFKAHEEPKVMIACGMSEGVDLAGPTFGFQIIAKVQWPSKQDKMIDMFYKKDIERIIWDTVRTIRQQSGRICRGADDRGVTYIIDSAFGNIRKKRQGLFQQSRQFWPDDIVKAMIWE
jgi:Rad3-related DNA helicase